MITQELLGSVVEIELTLDGQKIENWIQAKSSPDSACYRNAGFTVDIATALRRPGAGLLTVRVRKGGREFLVNGMRLAVRSPLTDLHRVWAPHMLLEGTLDRITLGGGPAILACANRCMPFVAGLNRYGRNVVSVGLLDQVMETEVNAGGIADSGNSRIVEFTRPLPGITFRRTVHEETVYIDTRAGSWFDAMTDFARYQQEASGAAPAPRHPEADMPLYCTWYAHGPHVTQAKIEADIDRVKDLGFKNYIIDEGWFGREPDPHTYRGDYAPDPERFPDFKGMIDRLHKAGLNVILWVSPFQVGKNSSKYERMKPHLSWWNQLAEAPYFMSAMWPWAYGKIQEEILVERSEICPRTGITQDYVPELVSRIMKDYGVDGLKIDFIDQIMVMPCRADHRHVHESMGEPVMKTVEAMISAIRSVKSDAIVEFRPPYANLVMRKYATLYRAQDCPWDLDMNRRLCGWMKAFTPQPGPLVVADYLTLPPKESEENIAKALAAIVLYSVPSMAEDFGKLPRTRLDMVRNWLAFYVEHRKELTGGVWRPLEFDPHYSTVAIEGKRETFVGFFKNAPGQVELSSPSPDRLYLINATGSSSVRTRLNGIRGKYRAAALNGFLREVGPVRVAVTERGLEIDCDIPEGGMLALKRE